MTNDERKLLETQKRRHITDLLEQYEKDEQLTLKTAIIKAGLSLIFGSIHVSDVSSSDHAGGGTHGPSDQD